MSQWDRLLVVEKCLNGPFSVLLTFWMKYYYIILFCEALKIGVGGGRDPGPPQLIGVGPPAVQPPRLID